jgi:hypothetical protein
MMKRQQQQSDGSTATAAVDDRQALRDGVGTTIEEVEVGSALGRGLKQMMMLLHAADTHPGGAVAVGHTSNSNVSGWAGKGSARAGTVPISVVDSSSKPLLRTVYEFNVDPLSEQDVPVVIIKSRGEARHQRYHDSYVHCSLSSEVSSQLEALYKHGKLLTIKQRRKRELKEAGSCRPNGAMSVVDATGSVIQSGGMGAMKPASLCDSIYDDDVVVGRYVPLGALEGDDDGGTTALLSSSSSSSSASSGHQPISSIADMLSDRNGQELQQVMTQQSREDLMKPVQVS